METRASVISDQWMSFLHVDGNYVLKYLTVNDDIPVLHPEPKYPTEQMQDPL